MPGFNIPLDSYRPCEGQAGVTQPQGPHTRQAPTINETARAHRWRVEFSLSNAIRSSRNGSSDIASTFTTYAKTCQRPSVEVDIITVHHQAEEIYRPGKYRWNTVDITFYELMLGDRTYRNKTADEVYKWWTGTIANNHRQASISTINNAIINILELDGSGSVSRRYTLYNCKLVKSSPSDLDHTSSDINTNTLTIKYDYAEEIYPTEGSI